MVSNQSVKKVKVLRSNNSLEFDDYKCRAYFERLGILHQTSCIDRQWKGGRKHRNILEMGRALRFQEALPLKFWGDCVLVATHITKRLSS